MPRTAAATAGAALIAAAFAGAAPRGNPNLNTLLFYTCATKEVANQCEESYTLDQAGIANVGFSGNLSLIAAGAELNITTLFSIHDTFFVNGKGLRPDWQQAWAALQTELEPLIEAGAVTGFFVGDELFPGKISLQDFKTTLQALATMKQKYPHLVTWENEGGTGWVKYFKDGGVPEELDIISLDDYYMGTTPQAEADGHRAFYEQSIYPLLKPHQKVFLVPGAFATHNPADGGGYPPPAPANSTGCATCPAPSPFPYGNSAVGSFCCPTQPTGTGGHLHCPSGRECCLSPGAALQCQGVRRCGTNPGNATACHQDPNPAPSPSGRYPKGNATYCYNGTFDGCDQYMAEQANAFAAWAAEDTRVAGFAPWHWDSRTIPEVSLYKEVGVVDMPRTKAAWREIGRAVRANAGARRERRG